MSEKLIELSIDLDEKVIKIITKRCTTKDGVNRFYMMIEAEETNKKEADKALAMLRFSSYPDIIFGTQAVEGLEYPWPITLEQYAELPEEVTLPWLDAIYRCNPSWRAPAPTEKERQAAEKKG